MAQPDKRYRGSICTTLQSRKSFGNRRPRGRQEELELTFKEKNEMDPQLVNAPFCWAHDEEVRVGTVLSAVKAEQANTWDIEILVPGNTAKGKTTQGLIETAGMIGLSLNHWPGDKDNPCEVVEVSGCDEGARVGTEIHSVWCTKLKKWIPLHEQTHSIAACNDNDRSLLRTLQAKARIMASEDAAPPAQQQQQEIPPPPAEDADMDVDDQLEEKKQEEDQGEEKKQEEKKAPPQNRKQRQEMDDNLDDDSKLRELHKRLQQGNLTARDRKELMDQIMRLMSDNVNKEKALREKEAKLAEIKEKEAAAEMERMRKVQAEIEEEGKRCRAIIGRYKKNNPDCPIAASAVAASKDPKTSIDVLRVHAAHFIKASADQGRSMSAQEREQQKQLAALLDQRRAMQQPPSKPSAHTPANAKKKVAASVPDTKGLSLHSEADREEEEDDSMDEDEDMRPGEEHDEYGGIKASNEFSRAHQGQAPNSLGKGHGLIVPHWMVHIPAKDPSGRAQVRASASSMREWRRSGREREADEAIRAAVTRVPWEPGTGANFNTDFVKNVGLRMQVQDLWSSFKQDGVGLTGKQASHHRLSDTFSPEAITRIRAANVQSDYSGIEWLRPRARHSMYAAQLAR